MRSKAGLVEYLYEASLQYIKITRERSHSIKLKHSIKIYEIQRNKPRNLFL